MTLAPEYVCIECGLRGDEPLDVHYCRWCGKPCHPRCKPDHECKCGRGITGLDPSAGRDSQGFDAVRRFDLLRGYFLEETTRAAISSPDQGAMANAAVRFDVPLGELHRAIRKAVDHAVTHGHSPASVTFADVEHFLQPQNAEQRNQGGTAQ